MFWESPLNCWPGIEFCFGMSAVHSSSLSVYYRSPFRSMGFRWDDLIKTTPSNRSSSANRDAIGTSTGHTRFRQIDMNWNRRWRGKIGTVRGGSWRLISGTCIRYMFSAVKVRYAVPNNMRCRWGHWQNSTWQSWPTSRWNICEKNSMAIGVAKPTLWEKNTFPTSMDWDIRKQFKA